MTFSLFLHVNRLILFKICSKCMKQNPAAARTRPQDKNHPCSWTTFEVKLPLRPWALNVDITSKHYSFICTCVPLTAGFPWDAVSCGVHRGGEKVETRGQGLAGVFPGHCTRQTKKKFTVNSQKQVEIFK